ncbi:extracellular metalloprotease [Xylariomycetidae sp. FL2044]|nr:extracellular metalloprotease [Xylariomycetidae sp. FL2044]
MMMMMGSLSSSSGFIPLALAAASVLSAGVLAAPSPRGRFCASEPSLDLLHATREIAVQEGMGIIGRRDETAEDISVDAYFHVVAASEDIKDGWVSDDQLRDQFDVLKKVYDNYGIHINLKGTTRTVNSTWADDDDEMAMKRSLRQGDYRTLNLYFQRKLMGDGALGSCTFPASPADEGWDAFVKDGCSINAFTVPGGAYEGYNLGYTAVHEAGHWFGLLHTFEGNSCEGGGDHVADTPPQKSATHGCPATRDSCPGSEGNDPIHNYMDYSDDACYTQFTKGQESRMHSMWEKRPMD